MASVVALLSVSVLVSLSGAQIGEFAGHVRFNISIGSTETLPMTIFDAGNQSINFQVQLPHLSLVRNATAPVVTVSPMNGTLRPGYSQVLNITVYLPYKNNTPGMAWSGIVSAFEVTSNSGGGASVSTGVGKIITIVAYPSKTPNYGPIIEIIIIVAVIAAIAGSCVYILKRRKRGAARPAAAKKAQAKAQPQRARKGAAQPRRRTTTKKKAATTASRRRATTKRTQAPRRRPRR